MHSTTMTGRGELTTAEAAALVGVTREYLCRLAREGRLPARRLGRLGYRRRGMILFDRAAVERLAEAMRLLREALPRPPAGTPAAAAEAVAETEEAAR